jgi:hypothetical protein
MNQALLRRILAEKIRSRNSVEIITVAKGSVDHPQYSGADLIELKDGSLFMSQTIGYRSKLRHQAGDDAPFDLACRSSHDVGRTLRTPRMMIARKRKEAAAGYCPACFRLCNGETLLTYETSHRFIMSEEGDISGFASVSRDECGPFSPPVSVWSHTSRCGSSSSDTRQLSTGRVIFPICRMAGKAIEELKDGRLLMVMRSPLGSVFKSYSADGGRSWANTQTSGLMSPESRPALLRIPQTDHLRLVWNHSLCDTRFDHFGGVRRLSWRSQRTKAGLGRISRTSIMLRNGNLRPPVRRQLAVRQSPSLMMASKYESLIPLGKLGRSCMDLKLALVERGWIF